MLDKLLKEIGDIIASVLDAVFGKSVRAIVAEILNNNIINYFVEKMIDLTVLLLALTFVIMLMNYMMNENKKEVIGLIARFTVTCLASFFVFEFATLLFGFVADTGVKYIVTATSAGLTEDFFTKIMATAITSGAAGIITLASMIFLLVMFIKFIVDFGKYAIQTQVITFIYPIYAINTVSSGWTELWNWLLNLIKISISVILLTMYMSQGMYFLLSAITLTDPLKGFTKLFVGVVLMMSKKPIEQALGKLGLFNAGGNMMNSVSSAGMVFRNTISILGR